MAIWKGRLMSVSQSPAADTSVDIIIRWEHPDLRQFETPYSLSRGTYANVAAVSAMLTNIADAFDKSDQMRAVVAGFVGQVVTT